MMKDGVGSRALEDVCSKDLRDLETEERVKTIWSITPLGPEYRKTWESCIKCICRARELVLKNATRMGRDWGREPAAA